MTIWWIWCCCLLTIKGHLLCHFLPISSLCSISAILLNSVVIFWTFSITSLLIFSNNSGFSMNMIPAKIGCYYLGSKEDTGHFCWDIAGWLGSRRSGLERQIDCLNVRIIKFAKRCDRWSTSSPHSSKRTSTLSSETILQYSRLD